MLNDNDNNKKKHSILWYVGVGFAVIVVLVLVFNNANGNLTSSTSSSSKASTGTTSNSSSQNNWGQRQFVDDFGDYTGEKYVVSKYYSGLFSNSATTNSNLRWYLIATRKYVAFFLYEYGYMEVKGFSSYPYTYKVSIKESDGTVTSFSAKNGSDRVMISNSSDYQKFLSILRKEKEIKISIQETGSAASSSYNLGTMNCSGFSTEFKTI